MAPVGRFAAVISLQGIEDVYSKLKGLGPAGEQAMRSLDSAVQNVKLDGLGQSVTRASGAVGEFRDGLHILHPILRVAGIEMGNFSAFSRAAGAGLAGLTVAITGAVIVGLTKLGQTAADTKIKLDGLVGKQLSGQALIQLQDAAKKSKTSVESLLPALTSLINLQESLATKPGKAQIISIETDDTGKVINFTKATSLLNTKIKDQAELLRILTTAMLNNRVETDAASAGIAAFFDAINKSGGKVTGDIVRQLGGISKGAADIIAKMIRPGVSGFNELANILDKTSIESDKMTANIVRNGQGIQRTAITLGQAFNNLWSAIGNTKAVESITQFLTDGVQGWALLIGNFDWSIVWKLFEIAAKDVIDFVSGQWTIFVNGLSTTFLSLSWDTLFSNLSNAWTTVVNTLQTIWQTFLSWIGANQPKVNTPAPQGAGGGGFAGGGFIRGPGTSTSDSILARLSAGEFVVRAKAVQWYGADLLRAINAMRLPRDFMRGFNMGGLVDDMVRALVPGTIPRFAAGGTATANMRPVILNINGQQFGGLQGTQDAVSQLERYAVISNLRATGRSPGWNK